MDGERRARLTGVIDWVPGVWLEDIISSSIYTIHTDYFYMLLMSVSDLLYQEISHSDYLDLQSDIRAKLVTYAILVFLGPYKHYTCHNSMVSRNRSMTKGS
jgi:hypothetical protein